MRSFLVSTLLIFFSTEGFAQLQYRTEFKTKSLTQKQLIANINSWAINNPRHYSSVAQNPDSSGLIINGVTSVFLDYEGNYNRYTQEDNYNYQLLVQVKESKCYLTMRNYISTKPNSQVISSLPERLDYIDQSKATGKKQKKILTKYAYDEYSQLEKHSAMVFSQIEKLNQ